MLLLGLLLSSLAWAQMPAALLVNDRLQILLQQQRSLGCDVIQNTLQSVLCTGQLKIGVRSTYKGFGAQIGDELVGYEIDFAHFIAKQLGVKPIFVPVDVFTRTQKLVEGETDLSLATITHTKEREETVHFILPHYYTSPTSVAGLKSRNIKGLDDLKGVSLCAPSGAYSNVTFQETRARMLLFDNPQKMFNALRFGACDLVTQDQALILAELTGSKAPQMMRDRFEEKFTFGEAPWGMAIRLGDREVTLGKAVALISAEALVTGLLEKFAIQHGVMIPFVSDQRMIWSHTSCYLLGGELSPTCLIDAPSHADTSSILAPLAKGLERWVKNFFDIDLTLPMLSGKEGLRVLVRGSVISLLLAIGVIVATVFFGLTFYFFSKSRWSFLRVTSHIIRLIIMNSPMILLLVLFYLVMSGVWVYTEVISVLTAVLAIGLNNGAMAGDSLVQSSKTFAMGSSLSNIARVSATPFRASVINATKASPIAAFIGAPELLSVLIDLTAFSGGRAVTLGIMTLFYLLVVQLVVVLSARVVNKLNMSAPGDSHA